ncbi:MAG: hypothetical protein AAGD22_04235 [Verrucomicrobiota bacterium]
MTLVELLVSMAVTSIFVLLLVSVLDMTRGSWAAVQSRADVNREARAALMILAADLKSAYEGLPDEQLVFALGNNFSDGREGGLESSELVFYSVRPKEVQPPGFVDGVSPASDLCLLRYYVATTEDGTSGVYSRKLFREVLGSNDTFEGIARLQGLGESFLNPPPKFSGPRRVSTDSVVAFNVVQFQVRAYRQNEFGDLEPWVQPVSSSDEENFLPACVDITLRVLGTKAAQALREPEDWSGENPRFARFFDADEDLRNDAKLETFSIRVKLPGGLDGIEESEIVPIAGP